MRNHHKDDYKINKTFESAKIDSQKYWIESSYKTEGNNKTYREFKRLIENSNQPLYEEIKFAGTNGISTKVNFYLCLFLGSFGAHKFYEGKLYLLTNRYNVIII